MPTVAEIMGDTPPTQELADSEKAIVSTNDKLGLTTGIACHFCGLKFDAKKVRSLRAHIEEVHVIGSADYMCGICCEDFPTRKAVESHMTALHRAPKPFACGVCGEAFRVCNLLQKHIDNNNNHSTQHVAEENNDKNNKSGGLCYCGECFEFFESISALQLHVSGHKEVPVYVCAVCGLQTPYRNLLVKHLETHVISNLLAAADEDGSNTTSTDNINNDEPMSVVNVNKGNSATTGLLSPMRVSFDASQVVLTDRNETEALQQFVDVDALSAAVADGNEEEADATTTASTTLASDATTFINNDRAEKLSMNEESSEDPSNNINIIEGQEGEGEVEAELEGGEEAETLLEEDAHYKCGVCNAFFTSLADALTHAGTHQDSLPDGSMQQVEINVLMEESGVCVSDASAVEVMNDSVNNDIKGVNTDEVLSVVNVLDTDLVNVKAELLDPECMDIG